MHSFWGYVQKHDNNYSCKTAKGDMKQEMNVEKKVGCWNHLFANKWDHGKPTVLNIWALAYQQHPVSSFMLPSSSLKITK